jgi:metal-responsive CopG/Arc/MetJ family transcriptional regulator
MQRFSQVGISLPTEVLSRVDTARGTLVSRSQMIRSLIERGIDAKQDGKMP